MAKAKLPPDPDEQNDDRAKWAEAALDAFMVATRCDLEDAVHDLLTDLHHYCDRKNLNFKSEARWAERMYHQETNPGEVTDPRLDTSQATTSDPCADL